MSDSEDERSGSGSENEEEEDDDNEEEGSGGEEEDDDEEGSGEEGSGDEEGSDDDDKSGSSSSSSSDSDKKKKKKGKQHAIDDDEEEAKNDNKATTGLSNLSYKQSKYQSIMSTLKDINNDLDDISFEVEKIHSRYSPQKSFARDRSFKEDKANSTAINQSKVSRNYHPPAETKKSNYKPQYNQSEEENEEQFNDREYEKAQETFGKNRQMMTGRGIQTQNYYGSDEEIQTSKEPIKIVESRRSSERQPYTQGQNTGQQSQYTGYPYQQKQVAFTDRPQPFQQTQQQLYQRKLSPSGRFQNQPSTASKPVTYSQLFNNGQAPMTSYTQFYRNQSTLQTPINYPQQYQMQYAVSQPQVLTQQPQMFNQNSSSLVGQQQQNMGFSQNFGAQKPFNAGGQGGHGISGTQNIENLQEAIDALLK